MACLELMVAFNKPTSINEPSDGIRSSRFEVSSQEESPKAGT